MSTSKQNHLPDYQKNLAHGPAEHPQQDVSHRLVEMSGTVIDEAEGLIIAPDMEERDLHRTRNAVPSTPMTFVQKTAGYQTDEATPQLHESFIKEQTGKIVQKATWEQIKDQHATLLQLQEKDAAELFGDSMDDAFRPLEHYESVCISCMDERVPGPKIPVAGSGVLMTEIPRNVVEMTDEDLYEYIANPASGDTNFRTFVMKMQALQVKGVNLTTSEHAGCGAVDIFCNKIESVPGWPKDRKLDRGRVASTAAARLHKALGLPGDHKKANYEGGKIAMNGNPHMHDGYVVVIAGKDVNLDALTMEMEENGKKVLKPVRGLLISAVHTPDDAYMQVEATAGKGILGGGHGVGIKNIGNVPMLLIGNPADEKNSLEGLKKRLGTALEGSTILEMNAT